MDYRLAKKRSKKQIKIRITHLRKSTIVPDITLVREAVANEAGFALFDVLLDGVEGFFLGDLEFEIVCLVSACPIDIRCDD